MSSIGYHLVMLTLLACVGAKEMAGPIVILGLLLASLGVFLWGASPKTGARAAKLMRTLAVICLISGVLLLPVACATLTLRSCGP